MGLSLTIALVLAATTLDAEVAVRGTQVAVPALSAPGVVLLDVGDKEKPAVAARIAAPDLGGLAAAPVRGVVFAGASAQVFAQTPAGFWTVELGAEGEAMHVLPFVPVDGLARLSWDGARLLAIRTTGGGIAYSPAAGERPVARPKAISADEARTLLVALPAPSKSPTPGIGACPAKPEKSAREIVGKHRKGRIENIHCAEFVAETSSGALARWRMVTFTRVAPGETKPRPERVLYDVVPEREKRSFVVIDPAP